jgi:predicted restriction endonuclease
MLVAHLDIAFDRGFITVDHDGTVLASDGLSRREREVLGVDVPRRIEGIRAEHLPYLRWHRDRIWQR